MIFSLKMLFLCTVGETGFQVKWNYTRCINQLKPYAQNDSLRAQKLMENYKIV